MTYLLHVCYFRVFSRNNNDHLLWKYYQVGSALSGLFHKIRDPCPIGLLVFVVHIELHSSDTHLERIKGQTEREKEGQFYA